MNEGELEYAMMDTQHSLKFSTTAQQFRTLWIGLCLRGHFKSQKCLYIHMKSKLIKLLTKSNIAKLNSSSVHICRPLVIKKRLSLELGTRP